MTKHTVKQGECFSSVSDMYGFFWETLWNHSENAELKQKRKDPNALSPGDIIFIPDKTEKYEDGATEQKHRFRLKGVPAKIKIRLMLNDEPRANEPYKLLIDGVWMEGTTDPNGFLEVSIPPGAQKGKLFVGKGDRQEIYEFNLGTIDPIETEEGIRQRLLNLGYSVGDDLEAAIRAFQEKEGIEVTGIVDDDTRSKLKEIFGQ
ncbi:peptidoglycan-binding protein [Planctomycetota bacterium]